jgi:hypothetical protein
MLPTALSRPKRATFIHTWASTIEPGSPAAPSPHLASEMLPSPLSPARVAQRPLFSAGLPPSVVFAPPPAWKPAHALHPITPALAVTPSIAAAIAAATLLSPVSARSLVSVGLSIGSSVLQQFRVGTAARRRADVSARRSRAAARAPSTRLRRNTTARRSMRPNRISRAIIVPMLAPEPAGDAAPDVRDGREVFLDDDEWEFAPLVVLDGTGMPDDDEWVDFDEIPADPVTASESVYSHPSDLQPAYAMRTPSESRATPPVPDSGNSLMALCVPAEEHSASPGRMLLTIPARSQRRAAHLRKPSYVTDALACLDALTRSPTSPTARRPTQLAIPRRKPSPLTIPSPARSRRYSQHPSAASSASVRGLRSGASTGRSPRFVRASAVVVSPLDVQRMRMALIAQAVATRTDRDVGAVPDRAAMLPVATPDESTPSSDEQAVEEARGREEEKRGRRGKSRSPPMQAMRNVLSAVSDSLRSSHMRSRSSSLKRAWL